GDTCDADWIWDREVETESDDQAFARASASWDRQFRHLMEHSSFYSRRFREAGVAASAIGLADITRLPFSTKTDLKQAIDERPPLGGNLCVPPESVKSVYQTSATAESSSGRALAQGD